ncbi:MAG TPA: ABC transporter ATP-binding protein [Candidatus Saccharimonadales bacterium]|nr:ABC transporter ATP-binding protein [Candidatus Saccharimonadales bacterium]
MTHLKGFVPVSTEQNSDKKNDAEVNRFTMRQYVEAMWHYKRHSLTVLFGFSFATICFGVVLPYLFAQAIELISRHHSIELGGVLGTTLVQAGVTVIIGTVTNSIGLKSFARLDARAQNYLREKVLRRLTEESAAFYANTMSGSLTSHVASYVSGYAVIQELIFQRGINRLLPVIIGIFVIAFQSLPLAGVFTVIALGIGVKTLADSRKRAPFRRRRKETMSKVSGLVGDIISNSTAVRTFTGERQEMRRLLVKQSAWQEASQANLQIFGKHYISLVGTINLLQVASLGIAAWLAATGAVSLTLVVFAVSYLQRLSSSLFDLGPMIQSYQGSLMDATPISEILMARQTIIDKPNAKRLVVKKGTIEIIDLTYRYEAGATPVFNKLDLTIEAGQSIGVVGRSGGGKTTLTNLILRFADSESGTITIDGHNITDVTQRSLRSNISYVPQDSLLFHRSIRDNIAYGKPAASEKTIIAAAKKAHVWELIKTLPDGLDTTVGERGVKLSGGQRQRIAIARAILKDAPILIFDEATSALDSESEQYIQSSLDTLRKGRTTIVIAHRLSTIQKMDRIIVLDKGSIVEEGTHAQLVHKKGLYAKLWKHQSGGFIQD